MSNETIKILSNKRIFSSLTDVIRNSITDINDDYRTDITAARNFFEVVTREIVSSAKKQGGFYLTSDLKEFLGAIGHFNPENLSDAQFQDVMEKLRGCVSGLEALEGNPREFYEDKLRTDDLLSWCGRMKDFYTWEEIRSRKL